MQIGQANNFQKEKKILVSGICAYRGRSTPVGVNHLIKSCKKFGIVLTLLDVEENWRSMWHSKFGRLGDNLRIMDFDWVINVDVADVLFIKNLEQIWENRLEDKVLWCAEKNCFPDSSLKDKYPDCRTSYRFVNGGGFFGKKELVMQCLDSKPLGHNDDDQLGHTLNYLNGLPMQLDSECKIFQTTWGTVEADFEIINGVLYNKETGSNPGIIHANGSGTNHPIYQAFK